MTEGIPSAFPVDLTRKWRALAERRKAHLVDLYDSGRWRFYYSEQEFILRLREAIQAVERWSATERFAAREAEEPSINPAAADSALVSDDDEDALSEEALSEEVLAAGSALVSDDSEVRSGSSANDDMSGSNADGKVLSVAEAELESEPA